ncbi:pyridoxal 5'-phosphate synthase glutaminase subunit PdxT [Aeromicrobium sp. CF3.5]|uniref:pyridoxal 5'-phosphate synthase glutaminase subunit PdxT n=1 Tax=Aeromicrobium sp. CF3.5 TaxID=3373078 RepID=UPI003EE45E7B
MASSPTIGVFALQGDVREHVHALEGLGLSALKVRRPEELAACDALILPGGESSTMHKLARAFELFDPLVDAIRGGLPTLGTCAGMILLADRLEDGIVGQETLGGLDVTVRRNAFGRQVESFEGWLDFAGFDEPVHGAFIRAPWVEQVGAGVEVLATVPHVSAPAGAAGRIVAVRQDHVMATSFHPEVGHDDRIHRYFVDRIVKS